MTESTGDKNDRIWVDPPAGWKYGFPRIYTRGKDNPDLVEWMIELGYPRKVMESYGDHFCFRMWEATENE